MLKGAQLPSFLKNLCTSPDVDDKDDENANPGEV